MTTSIWPVLDTGAARMRAVDDRQARALNTALSRVGDRWSWLIVNALLAGPLRFNELQGSLEAISTNVLSQRLKHLESQGVVVATVYSQRPARYTYGLTSSGKELASALRLLARWGADRTGDLLETPTHAECGTPLETRWYCPTCARELDEVEERGGDGERDFV